MGVRKVINQVKQTGKKPSEIYEDTIVEPTIREDIGSNNIDVKMKNKYLKQIQKILKSYHKKWDCFGNRKNEKKNKTR